MAPALMQPCLEWHQRPAWGKGRSGLAAVLVLIVTMLASGAQAASLDLPLTLKRNLRESVIRIALHKYDAQHRLKGPPATGHGVYIDAKGTAVTALHVVAPQKGDLVTAVQYQLRISEWDRKRSQWVEKYTIKSSELDARLAPGVPLSECQVNEYFPGVPCLLETPPRELDYALITIPVDQSNRFVDVMGPADRISLTILSQTKWLAFAVADFFDNGYLEETPLEANSDTAPFLFQTETNRRFVKGVSGSPILIFVPHGEPAVFLAGVAVEQMKPPHYQVRAVLLQEFLRKHLKPLAEQSQGLQVGDCELLTMPYPFSLLENLLTRQSRSLQSSEYDRLVGCMQKHPPWYQTYALVEFLEKNGDQLSRGISRGQGEWLLLSDRNRPGMTVTFDVPRKGRKARRDLAEVLEAAYERRIDPVDLLAFGAVTEGAGSGRSEKEIEAWMALAGTIEDLRAGQLQPQFIDLLNDLEVGEVIVPNESIMTMDSRALFAYDESNREQMKGVS